MRVYRLAKSKYPGLTGEGGMRAAGRWNLAGRPVVYTSSSQPLALTEVLAHAVGDISQIQFLMYKIELPDGDALYDRITALPPGWNLYPPGPSTQQIGDDFLAANTFLGLWVPSVIVPDDWNLLLNPLHAAFGQVKLVESLPFPIDRRLIRDAG